MESAAEYRPEALGGNLQYHYKMLGLTILAVTQLFH